MSIIGPKDSSWAKNVPSLTLVKTVGSKKYPGQKKTRCWFMLHSHSYNKTTVLLRITGYQLDHWIETRYFLNGPSHNIKFILVLDCISSVVKASSFKWTIDNLAVVQLRLGAFLHPCSTVVKNVQKSSATSTWPVDLFTTIHQLRSFFDSSLAVCNEGFKMSPERSRIFRNLLQIYRLWQLS